MMKAKYIAAAVLGFLAGALALTWWLSPRLASWIPKDGLVSSGGNIGLTLSKPVTVDEVTAHLQIEPDTKGEYWTEDKIIWFRPQDGFNHNQVYTVTLASGIRAASGLPSLIPYSKNFQVIEPKLIYLREDDGVVNIWQHSDGYPPQQYTKEVGGIWDYNLLPDGQGTVLSTIDQDGSDDLVKIWIEGERETLLECVKVRCREGRQQPNGQLVAFERQAINGLANRSEVWLLDPRTGSERPAYSSELAGQTGFESLESSYPRWSNDGQYLAYYKPDARMIIIQPMSNGEPILIPANLQLMGEWSPERNQVAYIEQTLANQDIQENQSEDDENETHTQPGLYNHLIIADIDTGEVVDFSEGETFNDGLPAWHPDGDILAVPRENGGGRQVWLIDPERRRWTKITEDPFTHHSGFSWSPDGSRLALMRLPIRETRPEAGIHMFDPASGEMTLISTGAFLPGWLP